MGCQTQNILLIDDTDKIKGWAFTFLRVDEVWFAIILDEQMQDRVGSLLLEK
jgi:hypothetical protein